MRTGAKKNYVFHFPPYIHPDLVTRKLEGEHHAYIGPTCKHVMTDGDFSHESPAISRISCDRQCQIEAIREASS